MEQKTLFSDPKQQTPVRKKPIKWCLPTNHHNLMYMLSAGLLMSPKGFAKKYYLDALSSFPGWIPLFADTVAQKAFEMATAEADYLKPCVAIVQLSALSGPVTAVLMNGSTREIAFPDGVSGLEAAILVPAPLPADWIDAIVFSSKEDKLAWEQDAQDFSNVPWRECKREVRPRLLAGSAGGTWPPTALELSNRDVSPDIPLAAGGMMALLYRLADRGDESVKACRLAFDGEETLAADIAEPLIRGLSDWRRTGTTPVGAPFLQRMFWGAVDKLAAARSETDVTDPLNTVYDFLNTYKDTLEEKQKAALIKLLDELRRMASYADSTISEILERQPKLFSRGMALFFLRHTGAELLELKHPLLGERDFIAAALLFGAREGWLGLPLEVRDSPGMTAAVSHRMAAMAHRIAESGMNLGPAPARCVPFRELLAPETKGWTSQQKEAALTLTRENGWDIVSTKVSLGKGGYRLVVDGTGAHIFLPGEVKAVEIEIDQEQFFKRLSEMRLSPKLERKIRATLQHQ